VSENLYRRLRELLPQPALQIADVLAINSDNTSTVEYPGGGQQRVRGTSVAAGQPAFVRNGVIEGLAPARTATVIEV
jgi:hypothetical protein